MLFLRWHDHITLFGKFKLLRRWSSKIYVISAACVAFCDLTFMSKHMQTWKSKRNKTKQKIKKLYSSVEARKKQHFAYLTLFKFLVKKLWISASISLRCLWMLILHDTETSMFGSMHAFCGSSALIRKTEHNTIQYNKPSLVPWVEIAWDRSNRYYSLKYIYMLKTNK